MTQNVDLQVKVKFVVDPKDLQAALSGGVGSGVGGGGGGGSGGGGRPAGEQLHMPGSNIPRIALPPGFMSQMQALTKALTMQTTALNARIKETVAAKTAELKVESQIARFKALESIADEKRHKDEVQRRARRMQDLLDAEHLAKRIADERKRRADKAAQDEAQALRKSQLSASRVGKGYGSEGMFAAGTSPIMQGLAWQSLFATGDILGPLSFAPMAMYQNYSLRRQRLNRGFNLGAGSDLAKAAGVGGSGQIATAGHALAAIRANTALTPEERERRMAQVDVMSAGRVRGRFGRGIEMFEAGQLGGAATRAIGTRVGQLGGVGNVALGAATGLGAVAMAAINLHRHFVGLAVQTQEATEAARASSRAARLAIQDQAAGDMPGAARAAALEKHGMLAMPQRYQSAALRLLQRGADPEQVRELIRHAESAEQSGIGVSADRILDAAAIGNRGLGAASAGQMYAYAGRQLVARGELPRSSRKGFAAAPGAGRPAKGSVGDAIRQAQNSAWHGAAPVAKRYADSLVKGSLRDLMEAIGPGAKAIQDAVAVSEAKVRVLQAELATTGAFMSFMQDVGLLLGGKGSAATRIGAEYAGQEALIKQPLGDNP